MKTRTHPSQPYTRMATYYDLIYHNLVDYRAECRFLEELFKSHSKLRVRAILDVGCGTGNHATILARRKFNVTGIDISQAMIQVAKKKAGKQSSNLRFQKMDMRRISLGQRFDAALILFGAFTYLLKDSEVSACFSSIRKHLNKGGLLIFEFWQSSGMYPSAATPQGNRTWDRFEDKKEDRLLIRLATAKYEPTTNLFNVIFDHYVLDTNQEKMIDQFEEAHLMRTYNIAEIRHLLHQNGFKTLILFEKGVENPPKPPMMSSGRVICIASPITK